MAPYRDTVVFVTAYDHYAFRAFEIDAVDYLLKPITQERFDAAVNRVLGRVEQRDTVQQVRAPRRANERAAWYATRFVARRGGWPLIIRNSKFELEIELQFPQFTGKAGKAIQFQIQIPNFELTATDQRFA